MYVYLLELMSNSFALIFGWLVSPFLFSNLEVSMIEKQMHAIVCCCLIFLSFFFLEKIS